MAVRRRFSRISLSWFFTISKGEIDPESLEGNDLGFSTAAIYRTYDDYANDAERYCLEYFLHSGSISPFREQ